MGRVAKIGDVVSLKRQVIHLCPDVSPGAEPLRSGRDEREIIAQAFPNVTHIHCDLCTAADNGVKSNDCMRCFNELILDET